MDFAITCHFCHESFDIYLDLIDGSDSEIFDCSVCCNPNLIKFSIKNENIIILEITSGNE